MNNSKFRLLDISDNRLFVATDLFQFSTAATYITCISPASGKGEA